jgi:hypothetical protein
MLASAGEELAQCADSAAWALPESELIAALDATHRLEQQVAAVKLALVREIDGRDIATAHDASSTGAWLRDRLRIGPSAARTLVTLAASLESSPPAVRAALAAGVVNLEQARVIADAVAALPPDTGPETTGRAADALLDWAGRFDPAVLRRLGQRVLAHVDPDAADAAELAVIERAEERAQRRRHLTWSTGPDGQTRLSGALDAEATALLHAAIDPLCDPHGIGDDRSPGQRRVDALAEICRLALHTGQLPDNGGERPQLVVTVDYDLVAGRLGAGTLDTGQRLTPADVRRLACDAGIVPAVLGGAGQVLDLGRQRRLITGPLRRALVLRDRGCAFPGCDRPARWCDAHHLVPWADGGPTALANAVLLCRHHHRVVHSGDWAVRLAGDGMPDFLPPPWLDPEQRPRRNPHHRPTASPAPHRHPAPAGRAGDQPPPVMPQTTTPNTPNPPMRDPTGTAPPAGTAPPSHGGGSILRDSVRPREPALIG